MANSDADIEAWLAQREQELGLAKRRRPQSPMASPPMLAALEASQALPAEDARAQALQAIVEGEAPAGEVSPVLTNALSSMAPPVAPAPAPSDRTAREPLPTPLELRQAAAASPDIEAQALAELRAAQMGSQRVEAMLPYLQAAQSFTAAIGRIPADTSTLQTIAATTRAKEADAAARLKAAQEFAKRRMTEIQFERLMGTKEAAAERQATLTGEQLELRRQAEERMLEAERRRMQAEERRGRATSKPVDEIAQRKRELEVQKLEREAKGEGRLPAEEKKKREQMIEIEDRAQNIDRNLKELRDLVEKKGTYDAFGPHNNILKDKMFQIAGDMAKLMDPSSVAREGEVANVMKYSLFEPSPTMRDSTALALIDNLQKSIRARKQQAYVVRGLTEPGQEAAPAPRSQFPMVVRDRQTGQKYTINSREEAERLSAIADRLDVVQ